MVKRMATSASRFVRLSGSLLVAGLADRLLDDDQTYDDLIGRQIILTVTLPRGESAEFSSAIVGVQDGFASRSMDVSLEERVAIRAWWFDEPAFLEREGYDGLIVRATDLSSVPAVSVPALTPEGVALMILALFASTLIVARKGLIARK